MVQGDPVRPPYMKLCEPHYSVNSIELDRILVLTPYYLGGINKDEEIALEYSCNSNGTKDILVQGLSRWHTNGTKCATDTKILEQELLLGVQKSTLCTFVTDRRFAVWPGTNDRWDPGSCGNKLAILFVAWAYILSARRLEIQAINTQKENEGILIYHGKQARWTEGIMYGTASDGIEIDVGNADDSASYWWGAVLSQGEGWRAQFSSGDISYQSPWSTLFSTTPQFTLKRHQKRGHPEQAKPPDSNTALRYLADLCILHNITGQCSAALGAALFLPFLRNTGALYPISCGFSSARSSPSEGKDSPRADSIRAIIDRTGKYLPYFMTISTNTWGLRDVLGGVFYNPQISCHLLNQWLEPVFQTSERIPLSERPVAFAMIMGQKQPKLAALWLGTVVSGAERPIMGALQSGMFAVNLHAAAWTATAHSLLVLEPRIRVGWTDIV